MTTGTKNLDCEFHGKDWNGYDVVQIPVKDIWASVPIAKIHKGKVFYDRVKADIQKDGMKFPLLVVKSTRAEVKRQKKKYTKQLNPLPFWDNDDLSVEMYTVWGGSNRLKIAEELGYDTVDCVLIPTFEKAHGMQRLHRQPFRKYY